MSNIQSSIRNWAGVSFLSLFKTGLVPMTLTALMSQFKQGKVYSVAMASSVHVNASADSLRFLRRIRILYR
jgi:hypothetical protein